MIGTGGGGPGPAALHALCGDGSPQRISLSRDGGMVRRWCLRVSKGSRL